MMQEKTKAFDFSLPDQNGVVRTLKEFRGKKLLLYFYPKDMTSGCTVEARVFRDMYTKLKKAGVEIVGVSKDSISSHKKFCEKEDLPFALLSDEKKEVIEKYGVWVEKSMYGKKYMGIQRDSFLIDEKGIVLKHYEKVDPARHAQEVFEDVSQGSFIQSL